MFSLRPKHLEYILGCTELQISGKLNLDVNINSYGKEILKHELKILRLENLEQMLFSDQ